MSIIEEYWAGVLQRLEAEVHVFAQLVAHEGDRGRENEAVLGRILEALVPRRYGIGSGLLIDTADHYSRQTDIVVYDQSDEPAVLAQTTQILFPMESVLACIEVKTTLRGDDIDDCFSKAHDMRTELEPARSYPDGSLYPLFVVLAYRAGQKPDTIAKKLKAAGVDNRPDLLCIVEQGVLMGADGCICKGSPAVDVGLALLLVVVAFGHPRADEIPNLGTALQLATRGISHQWCWPRDGHARRGENGMMLGLSL